MGEGKNDESSGFSFMKEQVKQRPVYKSPTLRRILSSIVLGILFGLAALGVWLIAWPHFQTVEEEPEPLPIELPEEEVEEPEISVEESTVYITETVSMELSDYATLYQQLMSVGTVVTRSLVNIAVVSTDTDWFDGVFTTQNSVSGMLIGDNGLELLILTQYAAVKNGDELVVTFYDRNSAPASIKKYDLNTGLATISVNLSDVADTTKDIITYAELGSSRTARSGQPVLAVGNPLSTYGSVLIGNLTSVNQTAALYDMSCAILTTDITTVDGGSGVLVDVNGKVIGLIQDGYTVSAQENTIQAYGISPMKAIIEHLSNSQDIVYMGIVGADVTNSIAESENIPVGVYVSEVAMDSPAFLAGIQPGDIITSMSGQPIDSLSDMTETLLLCSNGQEIQVICQRQDKAGYEELELTVALRILE